MVAAAGAAERKAVDYVVGRFFTEGADGWHQARADRELQAYSERIASASESAKARWSKRNANAMRTHSEPNANHRPVTSNHKPKAEPTPKPPPTSSAPVGVRAEVWEAWRRAKGKKLTPDAIVLQSRQLADYAAAGDDPNEVIEQSIRNTWAGLFPLKSNGNGGSDAKHQRRAKTVDGLTGRAAEGTAAGGRVIDAEA
jgi:hypothetical protein